jgi:hypothetical protein
MNVRASSSLSLSLKKARERGCKLTDVFGGRFGAADHIKAFGRGHPNGTDEASVLPRRYLRSFFAPLITLSHWNAGPGSVLFD